MQPAVAFEIPRLRHLARHAVPHLVEATLAPLALFYAAMAVAGVWGALGVALAWSYGAILVRLVTRRRVPGMLVLGAVGLTVRTVIAVASGSVFIYFLQPTLGTVAVAGAFLASVAARRPLAEKLAADFCPLPLEFARHPHVRRFFAQISLLWSLVFLTNAAVTIWLLLSQSVGTYLMAKTVVSMVLTGTGVAVSTVWFKRSMRRHGLLAERARAGGAVAALPAAA